MDWKNASKNELPVDGSEVLVSVDNEKFVAVYDSSIGGFRVKGKEAKSFYIKDHTIYWMEINKPS
jgi:hypothetical protein